jgi:WD40 repeat protein
MSSEVLGWVEYSKYVSNTQAPLYYFCTIILNKKKNLDSPAHLFYLFIFLQQPIEDDLHSVNSLAFHRTHDLLVTASNDHGIRLYDTQHGIEARDGLYSRKYGVANISFAHDHHSVIYSSTKVERLILT